MDDDLARFTCQWRITLHIVADSFLPFPQNISRSGDVKLSIMSTTQTSPQSRLQQISGHMASQIATVFAAVEKAPEDPLFGLMAAYRADTASNKVDLGIGAYRDDNAKPWVLPVVKKVCTELVLAD